MSLEPPAFLVDAMLGKLARWLVLMGYDASSPGSRASDLELLSRAQRERRVFVTRDRRIPPVAGVARILIDDPRLEAQLAQVFAKTGLTPDPSRWFTRCAECNHPLEALTREAALPSLPPKARELATVYRRCASCARVYWDGTHVERAKEKLARWGFGAAPQSFAGSSSDGASLAARDGTP